MSVPANNSVGDRVTVYIDLTRHGYRPGPRTLSHTPAFADLMGGAMIEVAHGLGLLGIRQIEVGWPEIDGWMTVTVPTAVAPAVRIAYASPPASQIAEFEAYKRAETAWTDARTALSVTVFTHPWSNPNEVYATTVPRSLLRRVLDRVRGWFR
ncbi:UNVERIFIED_ORG: hypothetical protein M2438_002507 [Methylobacterium sp. SuP10 SLI 274]|uniref:hypothetical protein n=1 Tax=Methylorubrum extorquens TaxID=408 RepID=UPI0020A02F9B|nr:hypothetical protein [Methylorubrum extorquens]MDF9863732.1 hypothetical protein [Methylorubrum pseudosasae]MDH6637332.1 hypothetical protein [Methylobacterium sp. SuP10 SLI 274]MDH6666512.1 hypothetical protein [Methylorubrum zatmanii]MCP1558423.1 hypothetical protein [Methylorubrum extorquens]MDF9792043.1 hypothetical protein [Methylorubrum extorquens]